jgi:hypothetical protein
MVDQVVRAVFDISGRITINSTADFLLHAIAKNESGEHIGEVHFSTFVGSTPPTITDSVASFKVAPNFSSVYLGCIGGKPSETLLLSAAVLQSEILLTLTVVTAPGATVKIQQL